MTATTRFSIAAPTSEVVVNVTRKVEDQIDRYNVQNVGENVWTVAHNDDTDRKYEVCENPFAEDKAFPMTCTCPEILRSGYCKHVGIVERHEAILTAEEDYLHRHEAEYAGRW
jgi:hypothetical protein